MKHRILSVLTMTAVLGAFAMGRATAQEGPDMDPAAWARLAEPGAEHAELTKSAGPWSVAVSCWCSGEEPVTSTATATITEHLGGRFVRQEYEGTLMGQPYRGTGYTGFNKATGKYEHVWLDTMGTGVLYMTGAETSPGKVWTFTGSHFGPGGREMKLRSVLTKPSADRQVMEFFNCVGETETKCMELTYTRSK